MSRIEAGFEGAVSLLMLLVIAAAVTLVGRGLSRAEAARATDSLTFEGLAELRAQLDRGVELPPEAVARMRGTPLSRGYVVDLAEGPYGAYLSVRKKGER